MPSHRKRTAKREAMSEIAARPIRAGSRHEPGPSALRCFQRMTPQTAMTGAQIHSAHRIAQEIGLGGRLSRGHCKSVNGIHSSPTRANSGEAVPAAKYAR